MVSIQRIEVRVQKRFHSAQTYGQSTCESLLLDRPARMGLFRTLLSIEYEHFYAMQEVC
jgi:hypothetical protein